MTVELLELYAARVEDRPASLPELSIQYADWAAWQRERMTPDLEAEQLAYWTAQLEGIETLELPLEILPAPQCEPVVRQETLDAVAHSRPVLLRRLQLTMQMPSILFRDRRNPNHTPHRLRAPRHVASQQVAKACHVQPVRLGPSALLRNLDARGVDDQTLDALIHEKAMKPEPFPTRLVAAHDANIGWQAELLLRPGDLRQQDLSVARSDVAHERGLTER